MSEKFENKTEVITDIESEKNLKEGLEKVKKIVEETKGIVNGVHNTGNDPSNDKPIYDDQLGTDQGQYSFDKKIISVIVSLGGSMIAAEETNGGFDVFIKPVTAQHYHLFVNEVQRMLEENYLKKGLDRPENRKLSEQDKIYMDKANFDDNYGL